LFSAHGQVVSAQIINDRDTGRSKGFGFVEMGTDQEAEAAIAALNGQQHGGRALTVNEARPREERGGGGGGGGRGGQRGGGGGRRGWVRWRRWRRGLRRRRWPRRRRRPWRPRPLLDRPATKKVQQLNNPPFPTGVCSFALTSTLTSPAGFPRRLPPPVSRDPT